MREDPRILCSPALATLGADLYSGGQFEARIRRFGVQSDAKLSRKCPHKWPFLAMARHRLGRRNEARPRWLNRLRQAPVERRTRLPMAGAERFAGFPFPSRRRSILFDPGLSS